MERMQELFRPPHGGDFWPCCLTSWAALGVGGLPAPILHAYYADKLWKQAQRPSTFLSRFWGHVFCMPCALTQDALVLDQVYEKMDAQFQPPLIPQKMLR